MKHCDLPVIRDEEGDLSGCCKKPAGLPVLEKIHRTLPARPLPPGDAEVLQAENGEAFNDEVNNSFMYDDWRKR